MKRAAEKLHDPSWKHKKARESELGCLRTQIGETINYQGHFRTDRTYPNETKSCQKTSKEQLRSSVVYNRSTREQGKVSLVFFGADQCNNQPSRTVPKQHDVPKRNLMKRLDYNHAPLWLIVA
jgi:hypothetical protein